MTLEDNVRNKDSTQNNNKLTKELINVADYVARKITK
jgi:hypothetical protein